MLHAQIEIRELIVRLFSLPFFSLLFTLILLGFMVRASELVLGLVLLKLT